MDGPRPKIQQDLAFMTEPRGAAPPPRREGTEPSVATGDAERPALEDRLMEEVCDRENLERAWKRVRANKGSPGVDGRTIAETHVYLRDHWPIIREQLLAGTYTPQPVKRVNIPKPGGGVRKLGIPCVIDRKISPNRYQPATCSRRPRIVGPGLRLDAPSVPVGIHSYAQKTSGPIAVGALAATLVG